MSATINFEPYENLMFRVRKLEYLLADEQRKVERLTATLRQLYQTRVVDQEQVGNILFYCENMTPGERALIEQGDMDLQASMDEADFFITRGA